MKALVIGCEKYYRRTFSAAIQDYMVFHDHISFRCDDRVCNLELILDEIYSFQSSINLDKVVIVGHSIHAYMAIEYAKKFPDKVTKILLIGSGLYTDFTASDRYFSNFASNDRKSALQHNLDLPSNHFADDQFIDRMLRFAPMLWYDYNYDATNLWEGIEFNHRAANIIWGKMFQNYKICNLIHEMLVIVGKYDFFNPFHLWDRDITIFSQSGHNPQLEESKLFNSRFFKFITLN